MDKKIELFLSVLAKFGWLGNWLFLFIALIECIPFAGSIFPGGTLIFIAGFLAAHGYFNVYDVFIFATLGAIIGDYSGYALGRWGGNWLRRKNIIKADLITTGEIFFHKYGASSIFWGRFIGATRAVVPFIAGSSKMNQKTFFFWNFLGAIGWALTHVVLGYFSGNIIATIIHKWSSRLAIILSLALIIFLIYWLIKKHHQNIWRYYLRSSKKFTEKLFSYRIVQKFTGYYPVTGELFQAPISQEKIFGTFLISLILIILYILVIVLDVV